MTANNLVMRVLDATLLAVVINYMGLLHVLSKTNYWMDQSPRNTRGVVLPTISIVVRSCINFA